MDSKIQQEIVLLMNIDNLDPNKDQIKILSMCSNVLSSDKYLKELIKILDNLFNQKDFDIYSEFSRLVLSIFNLNKVVNYKKEISEKRMKYITYACLYYYMIKHKTNWFNEQDHGKIRILFCNSWDLVSLIPETVKIAKTSCISCLSECGWLGIKSNNIAI